MSTTIAGKLNQDASEFAAGESTGFGIRLGVQYYDRETQQKEWTNYEGALFAKNAAQINYLRDNLRKDCVIEVGCDQLKIKTFDGQNGPMLSLEMIGAKLGYSFNPNYNPNQQAAPQGQPQGQGFAPQQKPQQNGAQGGNWQQSAPQPQQGGFAPQGQSAQGGFAPQGGSDIPFA